MQTRNRLIAAINWVTLTTVILYPGSSAAAQDRLPTMPGYDRYVKVPSQLTAGVKYGTIGNVKWLENGKGFDYEFQGKRLRFDFSSKKSTDAPPPDAQENKQPKNGRPIGNYPERGRQWNESLSPDGNLKAYYRDRNLWVSSADGSAEYPVTTEGDLAKRTKFGTGSWVYGEELGQTTAMWWSPDGKLLAYYGFDESKVADFYLQMDQTKIQSSLDVEAYPKAGTDNPVVNLYVYDLAAKRSIKIDVRDGQPFENQVIGYYVYNVSWSPDGSEILMNRTNRRQNIMEFTACKPSTGACRVILREEWLPSWVENTPTLRWLDDKNRFIWESERNGFLNYYLYDLSGKFSGPITNNQFDASSVVRVDEKAGVMWYTARDGDNFMKQQLHRVGLDGKGDKRLTDPAFTHEITLSPDGKYFIDVIQTHDRPPETRLVDANGKVIAELAKSDISKYQQLGGQLVELFTFKAGDGVTELHGILHKPSNFDPNKKYPVLLSVYSGPATNGASERFQTANSLTELGFLCLQLDARSAAGRGKKFLDAIYLKLGTTEIDDLAAGVKALWDRPYVDKNRVGIYGTSYGGYASLMALVRYPEVFAAAVAGSPVTDWRHYDTIYTERYMWIPQENTEGYDAGSGITFAGNLKGRLLIYYGTADNNVHPNNSMQMIKALQKAGKNFEVQVGPDLGHSGVSYQRMLEFFVENLNMKLVPIDN